MATAIVHYHEIALKGGNRHFFEAKLKENLGRVLKDVKEGRVQKKRDHFRVYFADCEEKKVRGILKMVCGVENFFLVECVPGDLEKVVTRGAELVREELNGREEASFRVVAHRSDKSFKLNSMEIAQRISAGILPQFKGLKVDLKKAEIVLYIDWDKDEVKLAVHKEAGLGGLPVGSSGKVVALISSGFDSPVASFMMMRRGATVAYVHFHSFPATGMESMENVKKIVERLNFFQGQSKLYLIPLMDFQKEVVMKAPAALRVLLYRRMMMRLAHRVLSRERAKAIVTGESLAQVASQTLDNLNTVNVIAERPVLRPLIGVNKNEIIKMAEHIGTAEISAQPYEDCCSLYTPKAPALAARVNELEMAEQKLDIKKFADQLWDAREVIKF